jgi:uncharacterized membrane protein
MAFQKVPAGNGVQWITESVNLILKNPAPFALMGLVIAVIGLIPILGGLALLVLGPALYGGIMYAANEQQAGRKADFQHLFEAFKQDGKLMKMIVLCLPSVAAGVILLALVFVMVGGVIMSGGMSSSPEAAVMAALAASSVILLPVLIIVGLAVFALTFFATPRVMLDGAEPMDAMKDSVRATLANIGPALLYCIVMMLVAGISFVVLSFIPVLGHLVWTVLLVPVMAVAGYVATRQVYRHDITREIPPATPPSIEL